MTPEELKLLLDVQSEAYQRNMESFLKLMNEKIEKSEKTARDLQRKTEVEMEELRRSLQYSQDEIDEYKQRVQKLEEEKTALEQQVKDLAATTTTLQDDVSYMSDQSRRNNVRITGMADKEGETWENTTKDVVLPFLQRELDMPNVTAESIERCHRVGKFGARQGKPRTIVVKFHRYSDRETAIRNAPRLLKDRTGPKIHVHEDLCPASQKKRDDQWTDFVNARKAGKMAYFRYTKLVTRDRPVPSDGNPNAPDTTDARQFPPPGHRGRSGARGDASSGRRSPSGSRSDDGARGGSPTASQRETRSSNNNSWRGRGGNNKRGRK